MNSYGSSSALSSTVSNISKGSEPMKDYKNDPIHSQNNHNWSRHLATPKVTTRKHLRNAKNMENWSKQVSGRVGVGIQNTKQMMTDIRT